MASILGAGGAEVEAKGSVKVTFTTNPVPAPNNNYAPFNVLAVWIEGPGGTFVKTIGRWSLARTQHLVAWNAKAGANDVDAVVGASRLTDNTAETVTWNLKNKLNAAVADGTYTVRMEMGQANSNTAGQNNQGTFTFAKGTAAQVQTALTSGGFTNVTINYDPNAAACGDMIVDAPEKCDDGSPAGNCPRVCPAPADACMPTVLTGSAAMCTAECVVQPITACTNGDGCCPVGCDATDDDCGPGGGGGGGAAAGNDNEITGGCAAGSGSSSGALAAFALFGAFVLVRRRRR
jgi:MYXO-CTERM domain-containing protein